MFSSVSFSESDTDCSEFIFKDVEKREVSEREVQMDGDKPVWMIQDALCEKEPELEYEAMFFYNQAEEVDDHQGSGGRCTSLIRSTPLTSTTGPGA